MKKEKQCKKNTQIRLPGPDAFSRETLLSMNRMLPGVSFRNVRLPMRSVRPSHMCICACVYICSQTPTKQRTCKLNVVRSEVNRAVLRGIQMGANAVRSSGETGDHDPTDIRTPFAPIDDPERWFHAKA